MTETRVNRLASPGTVGIRVATPGRSRPRLAVVLSHPIQHFCPQYASWAANVAADVHVFFGSSIGLEPYEDKLFGRTVQWEGLNLDAFPHTFLGDGSPRPVTAAIDALDLDDRLSQFNPDAVLVYGYSQRLQKRARAWARQNGRKLVYFSDSEGRQTRPLLKRVAKQVALRRIFAQPNIFATVGDANEAYYQHYGVPAEHFVRLPLPIDVAAYEVARADAHALGSAVRERHGIAPDDAVVSMAGKLVPWKRQMDLVQMLDALPEAARRTVVVLIGTGQDEPALRALAERQQRHRVVFAGFVQPSDLPGYYAASDLYAHVAEREPHSVAVSEAVFMGCPVVLSDRCGSYGPSDDVQVGRNGIVYPCSDVPALAAAVATICGDSALAHDMAAASREHGTRAQHLAHGVGLTAVLRAAGLSL